MSANFTRTIFVSPRGNDFNDGLSMDKPIRTLAKAAQLAPSDGEAVLLEGNCVHEGMLQFTNITGVTIGGYGPGQPVIRSGNQSGVVFENCRDMTLTGVKLIGAGWKVLNNSHGVLVRGSGRVLVQNVEVTGYHAAGIEVHSSKDVRIIGCFAHDNASVGIYSGGTPESENVTIAFCKAYDNAGDYAVRGNHSGNGIVIGNTNHSVVEFCEAAGNGWAQRQTNVNGPVGIWCCVGARDVVFRWNIARHNRTQPGAIDGDGLDIDGEVRDGLMEYNYTYGNEGAGYLLCEYWGTASDVLWENNRMRYNVSFEDAIRIPGYGPLNYSAPRDVPFEKMYVERNLLSAGPKLHAVYNYNLADTVKDLNVTDNIFVTDGTRAINDENDKNTRFENNVALLDNAVREDIAKHAPRLTDARDLPKQPVYAQLQNGNAAEILKREGASAMFVQRPAAAAPQGTTMMMLRMDGLDLEGCDQTGDLRLSYDSIKPGVSTRMSREGDEFYTPLTWWTKGRRNVIRAKARLQSPDVKACLFLRDADGTEQKAYFAGTVAAYGIAELEFVGGDAWGNPGKFVGIRHESGHGSVFVDSIEVIELPADSDYREQSDLNALSQWNSCGDGESGADAILLHGAGSGILRAYPCGGKKLRITASCRTEDGEGLLQARSGGTQQTAAITADSWTTVSVEVQPDGGSVDIGFWNVGRPAGKVLIKEIAIVEA
ncbi:right-handed parallel beta-helix repeat-containing protein [Cohnella yongneupensis]|uniref:Right-handed parallel beta-helix repeat-containing protein n=1 Tax=Cohnella yongneupensis TaxID=425006 RepID=A0ABW0R6C3_9BACL